MSSGDIIPQLRIMGLVEEEISKGRLRGLKLKVFSKDSLLV